MTLNVANVELTDSFNTWRLRTNEIILEAASSNTSTTYVATQTFNAPVTFNANTTFNAGIEANYLSVTGDIDGTDITGTTLTGTLQTAAQPNITSVGTLTSLNISGALSGATTITASGEVSAGALEVNGNSTMSGTITGVTTFTASGEIQGGTLDINGAASIAGAITDVTDLTATGTVTAADFNSTSDKNLKINIERIEDSINKIEKLSGYTFEFKDNGKPSAGLIAQEVQEVLPQAVVSNDKGNLSLNYNAVIGIIVESIKEIKKEIELLKKK